MYKLKIRLFSSHPVITQHITYYNLYNNNSVFFMIPKQMELKSTIYISTLLAYIYLLYNIIVI